MCSQSLASATHGSSPQDQEQRLLRVERCDGNEFTFFLFLSLLKLGNRMPGHGFSYTCDIECFFNHVYNVKEMRMHLYETDTLPFPHKMGLKMANSKMNRAHIS